MARYTSEVASMFGPIEVALTHLDIIANRPLPICMSYHLPADVKIDRIAPSKVHNLLEREQMGRMLMNASCDKAEPFPDEGAFIEHVESCCRAPVSWLSHGPCASNKRLRYSSKYVGSSV